MSKPAWGDSLSTLSRFKYLWELQYLFDKSTQHVIQQGKPSIGSRRGVASGMSTCLYSTQDGKRHCGAWPFIRKYKPAMDRAGGWVSLLYRFDHQLFDPLAVKHPEFVMRLQNCHDNAAISDHFMTEYLRQAESLANRFGLKFKRPC